MLDKVEGGSAFKAKYKERFKRDADAYAASYLSGSVRLSSPP